MDHHLLGMDYLIQPRREGFDGQQLYRLPRSVLRRVESRPFTREFVVTDLGYFPSAPGHRVERPDGIPNEILIHVIKGHGWARLGHTRYAIGQGEVLRIPAGVPHEYGADAREPWSICWVHFRGSGACDLVKWTPFTRARPVTTGPPVPATRRRYAVMLERVARGYGAHTLLQLSAFLVELLHELHTDPREHSDPGQFAPIEHSMELMRRSVAAPDPLAHYAHSAGLSVAQYSKLFHAYTGTSPMNYLFELRMQRACELLASGHCSVKEIAHQLGYDDPFYFSRAFKRATGRSPLAYRREPKG